jgi:hypothetical protein
VQVIGQLSRPSSRLQAVLELSNPPDRPYRPVSPNPGKRLGNGVVQRAVVGVLSDARGPLHIAAIRAAVERLLGRPVSRESVSWCLRMDVKGEGGRFERVSYGVYRSCSFHKL